MRNVECLWGQVKSRPLIVSGDSQFPLGYTHSGLAVRIQMAGSNGHLWLHEPNIKKKTQNQFMIIDPAPNILHLWRNCIFWTVGIKGTHWFNVLSHTGTLCKTQHNAIVDHFTFYNVTAALNFLLK